MNTRACALGIFIFFIIIANTLVEATPALKCGGSLSETTTANSIYYIGVENTIRFACGTDVNVTSAKISGTTMTRAITGNLTLYNISTTLTALSNYSTICDKTNITFAVYNSSGNQVNSTVLGINVYPCILSNTTGVLMTPVDNETFILYNNESGVTTGYGNKAVYESYNATYQKANGLNSSTVTVVIGSDQIAVNILSRAYNATDQWVYHSCTRRTDGTLYCATNPDLKQQKPADIVPGAIVAGVLVVGLGAAYAYARTKKSQ